MLSRLFAKATRAARHVTSEMVWVIDTAHVFGPRWGWDWVIIDSASTGAMAHPAGKRWGWAVETQPPSLGAEAWSLVLWLGPLYGVLDRIPTRAFKRA